MARKPRRRVSKALAKAEDAIEGTRGISPNPMTNLLITDLVLRGGGQIMRHAVERAILGTRYPKEKAKNIVKGRSMVQTMVGTALARVATRSVPGAILVGGGVLAKTLYDINRGKTARKKGAKEVRKQAAEGGKESDPIVS